jgi:diguanylate cyclase (GGDEF)-like protein
VLALLITFRHHVITQGGMMAGVDDTRADARWFERVIAVPDSVVGAARRRTRTLLGVSTLLAVAVIPVAVLVTIAVPDDDQTVILGFVGWAVYAAIRLAVARRQVLVAAWIFVGFFIAVPLNSLYLYPSDVASPVDLMFVAIVPIMAAIVLPTRHVIAAGAIAVVELLALSAITEDVPFTVTEFTVYALILLSIIGCAACVLTLTIDRAFDQTEQTRIEAERLADELQVANSELEHRVRSRTMELADALQREQQLSAQLAELSVRDSLTGLHNRRHMDETIDQMFRYAMRSGDQLSVAVIDLDDFKPINDHYTHMVGDQVLKRATEVMASTIRGSDELVRMGGEEFALLMPGTSSEEAVTVCDRMRVALQECDWDQITSGIVLTASFGIATTGVAREVPELVRSADEQLLKAKRTGKNRVLCADTVTTADEN